mgnify:CR=1 FL=1
MLNKFNLKLLVLLLLTISLSVNYAVSQTNHNECKVLKETISDFYKGGCKKGLAHGSGVAKGTDSYEGKFKKGLPHGYGKYVYKNGDYYQGRWKNGLRHGTGIQYVAAKSEKINGIWKDGTFIKEIIEPDYKVLQKRGVEDVKIVENIGGEKGSIEIYFKRDGNTRRLFNRLTLSGNSGNIQKSFVQTGFFGVWFPFEGSVDFEVPNRTETVVFQCFVEFKINKEGAWKVIIEY